MQQASIEIAAGETALTLNAKCYGTALRAFASLIGDLAAGRAHPQPQNLAERTFFPRAKRPPGGCTLSWAADAGTLAALVCALQFGPDPNPLGLPKIVLGAEFVAVMALDVLDTRAGQPPGTIVSIGEDVLIVATATHDVALRELLSVEPGFFALRYPAHPLAAGLREVAAALVRQ